MPYTIQSREVKVSWKPWVKKRIEYRRVWDMDGRLRPEEVSSFIWDQLHCGEPVTVSEWKPTVPELRKPLVEDK